VGFRKQRTEYKLMFADPELQGLEVVTKSMPLAGFFAMQQLQRRAATDPEAAEQVVRKLGDVILRWNLETEEGEPVPSAYAVCTVSGRPGNPGQLCTAPGCQEGDSEECSYAGLADQELPFVLTIFRAWMEAVASIPNRSKDSSNGGETSPELSIPMERLKPSQLSWMRPRPC